MDMDSDSSISGGPDLTDVGLDMSNSTVASEFLDALLDDTTLQVSDYAIARAFWYGIVIVIVLVGVAHWTQWAILKLRLRAAAANRPRPASPSNPVTSLLASCTAVVREISYHQITFMNSWFRIPTIGDYPGAQHLQAQSIRAGWLTIAQFPLILLLAGKRNLIGYAVGVSYERLQILHRWVARVMLLTATIHGAVQTYGWHKYGVMKLEFDTDSCIPTGFATWIIMVWLVFSSTAPIRNWRYEFFVIQHIITFVGLVVAIFYHLPSTALSSRIYAWIGVGLFILDRLVRTIIYAYVNMKPAKATITELPGDVTKIRISSPRLKRWTPGQHVFLSIPKLGVGQSHPATILSIPSSHNNDLVFILRAHRGFTRRLLKSAKSSSSDLLEKTQTEVQTAQLEEAQHISLIGGPYGGSHADFAAFDTAVLIAGSTGVTFTLPILLDIAQRATDGKLPVRKLVFVWVIRTVDCTEWVTDELQKASQTLLNAGIELEIRFFVTCAVEPSQSSEKLSGCPCTNTEGPCCCSGLGSSSIQDISETILEASSPTEKGVSIISSKKTTKASTSIPSAVYESGRPPLKTMLWDLLDHARGETGVAVCGPLGLVSNVRNTVATVSEERGSYKGTGAEGVYLHAESFAW
ncbi:hypothetical protein N7493_007843 [Penicillium malachiteum]|uniref:ferric-chelate reductase (NADPH) n=1 Tax=Penicillium malachiteum TaxID=1324776 RepID=A0AAD6HII2_9EURO|nr:hypothetical protein N7493_007843 [Penicillium malachiteum]